MSPSKLISVSSTLPASAGTCSGSVMYCDEDQSCRTSKRPLFCLEFFKQQVRDGNWDSFNKRRIEANLEKLEWDYHHLRDFLLGIKWGFQRTVDNCQVHDIEGYEMVNADQYEVHWDEVAREARPSMRRETIPLSVKIAVISDEQGVISGAVTFHTSGAA